AVAVGLRYPPLLATRHGRIAEARVAHLDAVLAASELSGALPEGGDTAQLVEVMGRDKKALDGLTFVLDGPDGVEVVPGIDPAVAADVLDSMR
ncbi:MAG: 3-dehydroquinate synthase, partial [Actinomycetota bacterium]